MARDARPPYPHLEPDHVLVAVDPDLRDVEHVAALLALLPDLLPRAGPEVGDTRLDREPERLPVHPGEHQHVAALRRRHDRRDQPVGIELRLERIATLDLRGRPARREGRQFGRIGHGETS